MTQDGRKPSTRAPQDVPARLIHNTRVRVLNCNATGCLLEAASPAAIDSVAMLQVTIADRIFEDAVQVVRCVLISDRDGPYHIATRFLSIAPPYAGSLGRILRIESDLAGWLELGAEGERVDDSAQV